MQTDFTKGKGNDQSGKVENEVFEVICFLFDFHVVKGQKVRGIIVISEVCFGVSQLFSVDEFDGLSPNVVKCCKLCFVFLILIFNPKDPHFSEVNKASLTIRILHLHFHTFGAVVEGKADLADGGRLLIFGCIDNEVLEEWVLFDFIAVIFLIDDEVDVWLNFSDCINIIADYVYLLIEPYFSELAFEVVP